MEILGKTIECIRLDHLITIAWIYIPWTTQTSHIQELLDHVLTWEEFPDDAKVTYDGYCKALLDIAKTTEKHNLLSEQAKAYIKAKRK